MNLAGRNLALSKILPTLPATSIHIIHVKDVSSPPSTSLNIDPTPSHNPIQNSPPNTLSHYQSPTLHQCWIHYRTIYLKMMMSINHLLWPDLLLPAQNLPNVSDPKITLVYLWISTLNSQAITLNLVCTSIKTLLIPVSWYASYWPPHYSTISLAGNL